MNSFKLFFENKKDTEYFQKFYNLNPIEYTYYYDGRWVIDTNHSMSRIKNRKSGQLNKIEFIKV